MAIALALASAVLFGAMSVALRFALARGAPAWHAALMTIVPALGVAGAYFLAESAARGFPDVVDAWPFFLAGLIAPGGSQVLFTLAVRHAGPSRTSVLVGAAPVVSVAIALVVLDEPLVPLLVVGAVLVVAGGLVLAGERVRPESFRLVGYAYAGAATVLFATRDNVLRWLAVDTDVPSSLAAVATLLSGTLVVAAVAAASDKLSLAGARRFALAGLFFGLSYVALFEAYYRGRVTVVSPLVATESLFGVLFAALAFRRTEMIGRSVLAGAALVVAGGALIGVFR